MRSLIGVVATVVMFTGLVSSELAAPTDSITATTISNHVYGRYCTAG